MSISPSESENKKTAKVLTKRIKLVTEVEYSEFWNKVFHSPFELDMSMLDNKEFDLVVKDLQGIIGARLKIDKRHKRIRIV